MAERRVEFAECENNLVAVARLDNEPLREILASRAVGLDPDLQHNNGKRDPHKNVHRSGVGLGFPGFAGRSRHVFDVQYDGLSPTVHDE